MKSVVSGKSAETHRLLDRYSDTIRPAHMVTTEIMWVHYRRYCWSLTAPSGRVAAIRQERRICCNEYRCNSSKDVDRDS
jgi:hypothetical protein